MVSLWGKLSVMPNSLSCLKANRFLKETHEHYFFILSFIQAMAFYSASSRPLLPRGAPDTARIVCRNFAPKRHRQLRVKDLPKVVMWRLERDSTPRSFIRKATSLPMSHHAPKCKFDD